MASDRAKVFWSGRSQAVRLPKKYRVDVNEMRIRKEGKNIVLEPIAKDWTWLDKLQELGPFDDDMVEAIEKARKEDLDLEKAKYGKLSKR